LSYQDRFDKQVDRSICVVQIYPLSTFNEKKMVQQKYIRVIFLIHQ